MTSRRTLMSAGLAAIPVGVGAALGIRRRLVAGTTLRLLGRDTAMLALFDTGNERVLFLLGVADTGLLENVSQLLPIGRRRLDMIVGTHKWLTLRGVRDYLDLDTITTMSLQTSASAPPIRGNVHPVTSSLRFALGERTDVLLSVGGDNEPTGTNPDAVAEMNCAGTRLILASGSKAIVGIEPQPHLLAMPGDLDTEPIVQISPELLAGTSLPSDIGVPAVQVFPDDALRFTVGDGSVKLREDQFFS